tara:strand:- start:971 stop:1126 length:156 start_codon:yes stop_codon:yes gene_type:complete
MRDNFKDDFDLLSLVTNFMFELSKAIKDFEFELDALMKKQVALEDTENLPM